MISSQSTTVERRCAMTSVVRPFEMVFSDFWMSFSVRLSSAEVASSKKKIAGFLRMARAIATRCFSPGKFQAAFTDTGIIPFRQCFDEGIKRSHLCRFPDLAAAGIGTAICNIGRNCRIEQNGILRHNSDCCAHTGLRYRMDRLAIDANFTFIRIIKRNKSRRMVDFLRRWDRQSPPAYPPEH